MNTVTNVTPSVSSAKPTTSVWVLHLNGSGIRVGPFLSEEAVAANGGGRLREWSGVVSKREGPVWWFPGKPGNHPFPANAFPVRDGLVCRYDDVPTISLREEFGPAGRYPWLPGDFVPRKPDGTAYTDAELDARVVDHLKLDERLRRSSV
jgi:hypothetical protein